MYVFDSESDLLVLQLMNQLVMRRELYNDLVYDCTDICEICICLLNAQMCTQASAIILIWKRELVVFFTLFVFLVSRDCCVPLPLSAVGLSEFVIVVFPDQIHYF